jgi:phage tail-like protein
MAASDIPDPFMNFNFLVEIQGIIRAGFQQVSGLDATIDVVEFREGGELTTTRKLFGLTKFGNLQFRKGMTADLTLYNWHRRNVEGATERHNGSVIVLDRTGTEVARWDFRRAWPTKYQGPEFNAQESHVALEHLELAIEGLKRKK